MKMSKTIKFMSLFSLSLIMVACQAPKNETKPTVTKASPALTKSSAPKTATSTSPSTTPQKTTVAENKKTAASQETNTDKEPATTNTQQPGHQESSAVTTQPASIQASETIDNQHSTDKVTQPAEIETVAAEQETTQATESATEAASVEETIVAPQDIETPHYVSYLNTDAILSGDYSSLNGVWVNGYGHIIIFENGQLVGNRWIESGFVKNKSGSVSASCRSIEGFGALMIVVPAGIRSLHAEVDSIEQVIPDDRDYITVGTSLPRYEDRYYRVN